MHTIKSENQFRRSRDVESVDNVVYYRYVIISTHIGTYYTATRTYIRPVWLTVDDFFHGWAVTRGINNMDNVINYRQLLYCFNLIIIKT